MSKRYLIGLLLPLVACGITPSESSVAVRVQFGMTTQAAPKTLGQIDHITFTLLDANDVVRAVKRTSQSDLTFQSVPDGTYRLMAEAFESSDDSQSITAGGPQCSSNTVTVASPTVAYSDGDTALRVAIRLADGTGETGALSLDITPGQAWTGEPIGAP